MVTANLSDISKNYLFGLLSFKLGTLLFAVGIALFMKKHGFKMPLDANVFTIWNCTAWTNSVVLGLPIGDRLFDGAPELALFAAISATVNSLVHIPLSMILCVPKEGGSRSQKIVFVLKKVFFNLSVIAVFVGYTLSFLKVQLPFVINQTMDYIGQAVFGSSLFCIGMFLASTIKMHKKVQGEKVLAVCIPTIDDVGRSTISIDVANEKELIDSQKRNKKSKTPVHSPEVTISVGFDEEEEYQFVSQPIPDDFQRTCVVNNFPPQVANPIPVRRIRSILDEMARADVSIGQQSNDIESTHTGQVSEHYPVNEIVPVTSSEVPSRAFVDTPALPPTEEELAKDPQEFWYFAMLLFLRLIAAPAFVYVLPIIWNIEGVARRMFCFFFILPNALTVFTMSKQYNIATTAINKMMFYGNISMPFLLLIYTYVFQLLD
ncbi:hypothetical protein RCL1_004769 [Eukaryota sp. TZLM3-RCL]